MVVMEPTAGYVPEMVDHVAANDGLRLQLIEYMPEISGHPEWSIDIERVHGWLAEQADEIEQREMHSRRRYWIDGGLVEVVDPVENAEFCANCHRVRVTHDGRFKGCLNRHDDHRSMGDMTKPEIRETYRETVANRVPYYGEYMVKDEDGEWVMNEDYLAAPPADD
jgi:cyclic pyranopterin phosphate synthase